MDSSEAAVRAEIGIAESALVLTTAVGVAAKICGVILAPGARGAFGQSAVVAVETISGALAYTLAALLVALVCGGSFELARTRAVNPIARGLVVGATGLVVALASPAVVERLPALPMLALAFVTGVVVLVSGVSIVRTSRLRALGAALCLFAFGGLFRSIAWKMSAIAFEQTSLSLHDFARVISTIAVTAQALGVLVAAAWIGTRGQTENAKWKGRILANSAIMIAFVVTWIAARTSEDPTAIGAMLRESLPAAAAITPPPYWLGSIAAFLVPASILLAGALLALLRDEPVVLVAPLGLSLLATGVYDVPLNALLAIAGAQWALLALAAPLQRGAPPHTPRLPNGRFAS